MKKETVKKVTDKKTQLVRRMEYFSILLTPESIAALSEERVQRLLNLPDEQFRHEGERLVDKGYRFR